MSQIIAGFADGVIPVILDRVEIAEFRCCIPVIPGGDGATTQPLEKRTSRCRAPTHLFVGKAPTCATHIRAAMTLLDPPASEVAERWLATNGADS